MDAFHSTLVSYQQHSCSLMFFIMCCFGSEDLVSVFFLFYFFFSYSYFFCTLFFHKLWICEERVTCVPMRGARGELDVVGWTCSQNRSCHRIGCQEESKCMQDDCLLSLFQDALWYY